MAAAVVDSAVAEAVDFAAVAADSMVVVSMAVVSGAAVLRFTAADSEAAAFIAAAFAPRRCSAAVACATDTVTPITGRISITGITFTAGSTRRAIMAIPTTITATGIATAA